MSKGSVPLGGYEEPGSPVDELLFVMEFQTVARLHSGDINRLQLMFPGVLVLT